MASTEQLYGRLSILSGLFAVAVAAGFSYFVPGPDIGTAFVVLDLFGTAWTLPGFILAALFFQFGTPLFCMASLFFGMRARGHWTGKAGMALAIVSLTAYGLYIRSCVRLFSE